jgi:hypothetical protein
MGEVWGVGVNGAGVNDGGGVVSVTGDCIGVGSTVDSTLGIGEGTASDGSTTGETEGELAPDGSVTVATCTVCDLLLSNQTNATSTPSTSRMATSNRMRARFAMILIVGAGLVPARID